MKRRQSLVTDTVGLATSLAGCSSFRGGDGGPTGSESGESGMSDSGAAETATPTGPAEFEEISLSAPESVTVGSAFSLTVSATNTGDEAGTYEGVVRLESSSEEAAAESGGHPRSRRRSPSRTLRPALGRDYESTVTDANEGDATGTFRGVIQWDDDGTWAQLSTATSRADLATDRSTGGVIARELHPGTSTDIAVSNFSPYNSQYAYRLQPFSDEWRVTYEEAVLSLGDRIKSNGNANVVVADLRTQDTVTAYDDWDGEEFEAEPEPEDGNQFVAVRFRFTKRDGDEDYAATPSTGEFTISADGNDVGSSTYVDGEIRESWYEPLEGELEDQPEVAGWDVYEVPTEYATDDLAVHFEQSPGFGSSVTTAATWTQ